MSDDALAEIKKISAEWKHNDDIRDAGLPIDPPDVVRYDNLSYGPYGDENLLDIYVPKAAKGKVPVIISCHGGGFFYGTKETYQAYGLYWAQQGFAFVNFNYRLAPKTVFPGALVDTDAAIQWVAEHGADYNLDLDRVILIGDSAGGTLAFQYITAYTQVDYRKLFGFKKPQLNIVGVLMNCGAYFLDHTGHMSGGMTAYFTDKVQHEMQKELSPENYVDNSVPPLAIVTANRDFLHDQGVRMDQFLIDKGIEHEFHIYGDDENIRTHNFELNVRDKVAMECNADEKKFFEKVIG